jgi:hypothetical protein
MFLIVKMNNKKKAITVLNSIKRNYFSFHNNYNIYRCRNIINKLPLSHNSLYYNYRNSTNEFRQLIFKTINLYSKFWTLLYETKFNHQNKFNELYNFGRNIINFNLKIDELYNMIINTKTNNINIFKLYSKYIQDILKDEEKYQKYQNSKSSIFLETVENEVKNFSNFNLDILKNNNNERFLLISGRDNDLGKILDCSINASIAFGYTKEELIGKHMTTLIPDLFHINHNITFRKVAKSSNINLCEQQFQKKEYTPDIVEGYFFGVLKSKFIKAFKLRVFYIKTEDNIYAFAVEILNEIPYMNDLVKNKGNNDIETKCCVLTNENFLIHEFTPNSIEQLGLSYRYMKSNNSIIPYIKQINDDYKNMVNDLKIVKGTSYIGNNKDLIQLEDSSFSELQDDKLDNISPEIKRKIKDDLINKKYNKKCQITWRIDKKNFKTNINDNFQNIINDGLNDNDKINSCSRISYRGSNFSLGLNKKDENKIEVEFIIEIKKAILNNHLSGYYFYFSRIDPPKTTNFISYNNSEKNKYDKKENLKIITKYKAIFKKSSQNDDKKKVRRISHSLSNNNKNIITNNNNNKKFLGTSVLNNTKTKNSVKGEYLNILDLINNDKDINEAKNENINEEAIIDETFIPNSKVNFSFDLKNKSYNYENDYNNLKALNEIIEKEATNKMNECQKYLKYLQKKEQESSMTDSLMEETESSNDDEDVESSDLDNDNSLSQKSIGKSSKSLKVQKLSRKSVKKSINLKGPIEPPHEELPDNIKEAPSLKAIQEEKEEKEKNNKKNIQIHRNSSEKIKINQGKNNMINFYKVNLNKVRFMIFDFNKDMVVEGNKNKINCKVEDIINNSKKKNEIISLGKDIKYPSVFISMNKDEKINKNKKTENNNQINDIHQKQINEEKASAAKEIIPPCNINHPTVHYKSSHSAL